MDRNKSPSQGEYALKKLIDRTTMYRLVLYYLVALFAAAVFFGTIGIMPYSPGALLWSAGVLIAVSWAANTFFARIFRAVTNTESVYITAFILVLIMSPVVFTDISGSMTLAVVAVCAMASKYILAIGKKHVFNPVAFAVVLSALLLNVPATWWVAGNTTLLPFVVIGGLIVVHKLRRFDLVLAFAITALTVVAFTARDPIGGIQATLLYSVFFFFAFVMLTEPLTTPPTRLLRVAYGVLVGGLFIPAAHIGSLYLSPELSLIIGNLFSYIVSPKGRYMLSFVERHPLASGIYEYIFRSDRPLRFSPGQYIEWTLGTISPDNRGNRRFFTIASAPESTNVALGVRFYDKPSAFKRALATLPVGGVISAGSLGGDFVMPKDTKRKLAFIAGGIGVPPFASMARHCIATEESRDAVLLYSSRKMEEVAYQDVFSNAERVGWRTVYALSGETKLLPGIHAGSIDAEFIKQEISDYNERLFYISGPPGLVDAMKDILINLGVSRFAIKTDFFPGLA